MNQPVQSMQAPSLLEAMTPFPFFCEAQGDLEAARALFEGHPFRHLPVKDDGRTVGVVTPRDLILASRMTPAPKLGEICERDFLAVDVHLPLAEVLLTMAERGVDCALVLKHEQLVGIFTTTDACRLLARLVSGDEPDPIVA